MSEEEIQRASSYYEYLSLYVSPSTTECAKLSCGCAIEATLAVARGEVANSLAIIRPPGHHAEPSEHMGFCFFNNVAVAARMVQAKTNVKKILIVDWYAECLRCTRILRLTRILKGCAPWLMEMQPRIQRESDI